MRVTNKMIGNSLAYNIQVNMQKLARTQQEMSTGRRVLRPSDDPLVISRLLSIQGALESNNQYVRNIDDGLAYLYAADTALGTAGDLLHDAHELAVQGANGTLTKEDMAHIGEQVDKMIDNMVNLANTDLGGKYIFAGKRNNLPPFNRVDNTITYSGDFALIEREIAFDTPYQVAGPGVSDFTVTPSPEQGTFGWADSATPPINPDNPPFELRRDANNEYYGVFGTLFQLRNALYNGNPGEVNDALGRVQKEVDFLLQERVKVGARTRHFESVKDQILDHEIRLKQIELDLGSVHMEKVSIDFAQQTLTYQAALGAGAQILQTSLLQFLR
ncbi:MAG: flagellar hook-associated protein FlgL [Bacillota bacterium]